MKRTEWEDPTPEQRTAARERFQRILHEQLHELGHPAADDEQHAAAYGRSLRRCARLYAAAPNAESGWLLEHAAIRLALELDRFGLVTFRSAPKGPPE